MNKQQFDMNIQAADNNSLRIGAANRIVQLLQKLRYSNNENSAKRWVWELCQNAKDVCNSTGKVKISINYDEVQRKVFFRHNGKAFSMDNILSLINQASSKDQKYLPPTPLQKLPDCTQKSAGLRLQHRTSVPFPAAPP